MTRHDRPSRGAAVVIGACLVIAVLLLAIGCIWAVAA